MKTKTLGYKCENPLYICRLLQVVSSNGCMIMFKWFVEESHGTLCQKNIILDPLMFEYMVFQ